MSKLVQIVARPYDAEVMRRAIAEAGYATTVSDWSSDGCQQVERDRPAAVVLSTRRAEDACEAFLKALRAGAHGEEVPLILVAEPGSRLATSQQPTDRLLLRPLDLSALIGAIRLLAGEAASAPEPAAVPSEAGAAAPAEAPSEPPRSVRPQVLRAGSLRDLDPARVIAEVHREGATGRLVFRRGEAQKIIALDGGEPVFATSNQLYDRLGDLLFREGKITREQYQLCKEGVSESGRRLGAILVDRGLIKSRELFPLVRRQVAEILYSVFAWTDGSYELTGGEAPPDEKIRLDLPTSVLVLEGIRRKYGLDRLMELVGPPDTCLLALPAVAAFANEVGLGPAERLGLELLDGQRSLQEIAGSTRVDVLGLYQLAHAALALGAVVRRGAGEVRVLDGEETVPAARQREQSIDRHRVEAKHAQVVESDYFSLLGVTPEASSHEVRRAYERAREEFSAEAFAPEIQKSMAEQLREIAEVLEEAFRVLGDEELRRSYRESIA